MRIFTEAKVSYEGVRACAYLNYMEEFAASCIFKDEQDDIVENLITSPNHKDKKKSNCECC